VHTKCSKRCFDGLLRAWRRRLHQYDPPSESKDAPAEENKPAALTKANLGEEADAVRVSTTFRMRSINDNCVDKASMLLI
jgi:Histone RNA hairpin-binding protein RNA-binding domain